MENPQKSDPQNLQPMDGQQQANVLDYVYVLVKWRKFIIRNVLILTLLTAIVTFLLPKWYKSTSSILPPKTKGLLNLGPLAGLSSLAKEFAPLTALTKLGTPQEAYNYLAVLKSRTAIEAVIRKFNLMEVYDISDTSMEKTIKELEGNVNFDIEDEGYITIQVYDKNPQRAADMANYFVEVLNDLSNQLWTKEARDNREFIEKRVEEVKADLRIAEDSLKRYQEQHGMIFIPEQVSSSISEVAKLFAAREAKEVERAVIERTAGKENLLYRQLSVELSELNKKLATFPEVGISSLRLYRDLLIKQKILEFIMPLYEQAKVEERRDVPVVVVLDKAVPAERKAKPKVTLYALLAAVISTLISLTVVFTREMVSRLNALNPEKYGGMWMALRGDWEELRRQGLRLKRRVEK